MRKEDEALLGPRVQWWGDGGVFQIVVHTQNGCVHRDPSEGPSQYVRDLNSGARSEVYDWRGSRHRIDGPAEISRSGDGQVSSEVWCFNGYLHRNPMDGPAFNAQDFDLTYCYFGVPCASPNNGPTEINRLTRDSVDHVKYVDKAPDELPAEFEGATVEIVPSEEPYFSLQQPGETWDGESYFATNTPDTEWAPVGSGLDLKWDASETGELCLQAESCELDPAVHPANLELLPNQRVWWWLSRREEHLLVREDCRGIAPLAKAEVPLTFETVVA